MKTLLAHSIYQLDGTATYNLQMCSEVHVCSEVQTKRYTNDVLAKTPTKVQWPPFGRSTDWAHRPKARCWCGVRTSVPARHTHAPPGAGTYTREPNPTTTQGRDGRRSRCPLRLAEVLAIALHVGELPGDIIDEGFPLLRQAPGEGDEWQDLGDHLEDIDERLPGDKGRQVLGLMTPKP